MSIELKLLCCPSCGGDSSLQLNEGKTNLDCQKCGKSFSYTDGVPIFLDSSSIACNQVAGHHNTLSSLRNAFRKLTRPRHHSIYFDSMKCSFENGKQLDEFIAEFPDGADILNVGSLSKQLIKSGVKIHNLDISHYPNVDIVADAHLIPLRDNVLDGIIVKNVFEHIREPAVVRDELFRVLKPGGKVYAKVPFMQPFHAVPDDYQRYTINGLKEFFKEFRIMKQGISIGPSSTISWILMEYFALLFSFNTEVGYKFSNRIASYLFSWIKYLDIFLRNNSRAHTLASAFYLVLEKPLDNTCNLDSPSLNKA